MFCPNCGDEDKKGSQFCRACGMELRSVRNTMEHPDSIERSAVSAREQIGHAIATKVLEFESSRDLKRAAEDILPAIDKFLRSPEQARLKQMQAGVLTSATGVGLALLFVLMAIVTNTAGVLIPAGAGVLLFCVGLGILINGYFLSGVSKSAPKGLPISARRALESASPNPVKNLNTADQHLPVSSVTESTTRELKNRTN